MSKNTLSIKSAISFGWESFFNNSKFALGSIGILIALSILVEILKTTSNLIIDTDVLNFIFEVAFNIAAIYITFGILKGCIMATNKKQPKLEILKKTTFNQFAGYFAITVLLSLAVLFGLVLLIIPGIYLALRFAVVEYIYIDKNLPIFENFKESSRLTKGNKFKILGFWLVLGLFNLAGLLTLVVGLLLTIPASFFAAAHFYKQLTEQKA